MELDIEALRLTRDERLEIMRNYELSGHSEISNAQLAKALWGMVEWLQDGGPPDNCWDASHILVISLRKAGLTEPHTVQ